MVAVQEVVDVGASVTEVSSDAHGVESSALVTPVVEGGFGYVEEFSDLVGCHEFLCVVVVGVCHGCSVRTNAPQL